MGWPVTCYLAYLGSLISTCGVLTRKSSLHCYSSLCVHSLFSAIKSGNVTKLMDTMSRLSDKVTLKDHVNSFSALCPSHVLTAGLLLLLLSTLLDTPPVYTWLKGKYSGYIFVVRGGWGGDVHRVQVNRSLLNVIPRSPNLPAVILRLWPRPKHKPMRNDWELFITGLY